MKMRIGPPPIHLIRAWPGALVIFPKHYVPKRDEIWQAGRALVKRCRR